MRIGIKEDGLQRVKAQMGGEPPVDGPPVAGGSDEERIQALAQFLGIDPGEIEESAYGGGYGDWPFFDTPDGEYMVLTDEEADKEARTDIEELLWAFNTEFIINYTPLEQSGNVVDAIRKMQEQLSEDANPIMAALVGDNIDQLVEDAIAADGRGHFLNTYDDEENEANINGTWYFIYRTN
jgi:hypothetical protein